MSTYKKIPDKISNKVNVDGKKVVANKEVVNRTYANGRNSCCITLKEHNASFLNNPKVCWLNPAKSKLDKISKSILDRKNTSLQNLTKANQWKDTRKLIEWLKVIGNKHKHKFVLFDIKYFYPIITKLSKKILKVCWRKSSNLWWW